jgi:alpha-mannosidase
MQGTDHMEPLDGISVAIEYYQHQNKTNRLVHSNLPAYFNSLRSELSSTNTQLSVVNGELRSSQHSALLQNVLSTRIWLKQRNHNCETELLKWVEPLNAWNNLLNLISKSATSDNESSPHISKSDQKSVIRYTWKLLMQCHPHDSICGTSIDQVAKEMRTRFDQVDQISQELIDRLLENICELIDTRLSDNLTQSSIEQNVVSTVAVFNPNDSSQSGLVNLTLKLAAHYSAYEIIDANGKTVSCDFSGMGSRELISVILDKKALKQSFGMIHEGNIAGMVLRDFEIDRQEKYVSIHAILSDHGNVNISRWRDGVAQLDAIMADPLVTEFHIHANSDPEIQLSFVARDVPQHGFACYWIRGRIEPGQEVPKPVKLNPIVQAFIPVMARAAQIPLFSSLIGTKKRRVSQLPKKIENEFFVVEANSMDGTLTITDKHNNQTYPGMNRFIDGADRGDLYNFCPPENDHHISPEIVKVEREGQNTNNKLIFHFRMKLPAKLSDERTSRSHELVTTTMISTVTLLNGVPRIDIHTEIENQARDHRLRVHFPTPFTCNKAWYDGHFELVERPIDIPEYDETWEEPPRPEVPQRMFTTIADKKTSLTIANFGLPEVEVLKNQAGNSEISITLLRCIDWLSRDDLTTRKNHAGPMEVAVPDAQMIGRSSFDYSIIPGDDQWRDSIPQAIAFNIPLKSMTTSVHSGTMPHMCSLIENSSKDLILTAIKTSEDGAGLIIRGYNLTDSPIETSLKLFLPIKHAELVSLDERVIEPIPVSPSGSFDYHVGGHKIVTFRLLF